MASQNIVNNKPNSIFDVPGLPFDLQQRTKVVGKTQAGILNRQLTNTNDQILWSHEIFRGDYSENSCFEIYGLFRFTNNVNQKHIKFKMNGTDVLAITNTSKGCCHYKRLIFNLNSFNSQVSFPTGISGDSGETGGSAATYTINTTDSIVFGIASATNIATDDASVLAAYVRVNY